MQIPDGHLRLSKKSQKSDVIANQSSDWCGDLLKRSKNSRFQEENVLKSGGLPRQCAHWLAMTWFFDTLKEPAAKNGWLLETVKKPSGAGAPKAPSDEGAVSEAD